MLRNRKILSLIIFANMILATGCMEEIKKTDLNISAASSLKESMLEIEKEYEQQNPNIDLILNFGGSGSLKQQIVQGAPTDVFISASKVQIDELKAKGYLMDNKYKILVENDLVLVSKSHNIEDLGDLKSGSIKKIAMGEPKSVPAGQYANEVLVGSEIKEDIEDKLVYAKDVKEVLAWVKSGNADAGFVYDSDILNDREIKVYAVEESLHSPIIYPITIIKDSKKSYEAKQFEQYLFTEKAQNIFEENGYK
ncbi:MAG: molybdate ABC transporter substrate-binding protein [Paraclostridium sp.]